MINQRSNSYHRFIQNNLPNNFNRKNNNNYYNIPKEEIKQTNYEANLLKGVDSNLNILLSNLKKNNQNPRIYYPLNSKIKSPMKIKSTNNFGELDLVDTYKYIVESYAQKHDDYLSSNNSNYQDNLSDFSYPYSYNNGLIINNSNNSRQNNNNSNLRMNLSYSGHQLKKIYQNDKVNKKRVIHKNNNYERNINLSEKNRNFNNNIKKGFIRNRNNQSNQNNIKIIPNNLSKNNPPSKDQLNEIMMQLKYLSDYNAQNKNDIFNFQKEYIQLQNKILSSLENLNLNNNINNNEKNIINKFNNENLLNNNINNFQNQENLKLKRNIINLKEKNENDKKAFINDINIKDEELIKLKAEKENLKSELERFKNILSEKEKNLENLTKENKDMKGKLLILEFQKKNITKENKINKEKLEGLQGNQELLTKERDIYQKQKNILDNEIKIMKLNNDRINTIKINNSMHTQRNMILKTEIENLTKEKNNLKEKNEILKKTIDDMNKKKLLSQKILSNIKRAKSAGKQDNEFNKSNQLKENNKYNFLEKKYKSAIKYKNKLSEKLNDKDKKIRTLENSLSEKQKEINELKERLKITNTKKIVVKPSEDKTKEIKSLEKKVLEKEIEIDEVKRNNKVMAEDNKKQKIQINKLKEKIKNLEEKNYSLNELVKSLSQQGKSQPNNEAKNLLFVSSSTVMNQNENIINSANINNLNLKKEKEIFDKKIKDLNNQLENFKKENDRIKKELKEKESQNKNLKKDLKEKEERISALETEIKLKEKEENRLNRGKLKESALYDNNNNDINNELKMSQLAEEDKINDLGLSQEELLKENEKLKDQIMLLKKDLELARASQQIDSINKEDKKDENQKNSKYKNILKDSYMSLGMDYQN